MSKLYYTPPTDEQFNELKEKAIEIWSGYDNEYGYVTEKIDRIKDVNNVGDNFLYIVAMFDQFNQERLAEKLSDETRIAIRERMRDGGYPEYLIAF